jgi:hypothetical protein
LSHVTDFGRHERAWYKLLPSIYRDGIGYEVVTVNEARGFVDDGLVYTLGHHVTFYSHRQSRRRRIKKEKSNHVKCRDQDKTSQNYHNEKELRQNSLLEWGCTSFQMADLPPMPLEQDPKTTMKVTLHKRVHWLSIVDKIIRAYQSMSMAFFRQDLISSEKETKTIKKVLRGLLSSLEESGAALEWDLNHFNYSSTMRACVVAFPIYVAEYHQRLLLVPSLPNMAILVNITINKMKGLGPQMVIAAKNVLSGGTISELHRELDLVGEKVIRARTLPHVYAFTTEKGAEHNHRAATKPLPSVVDVPDVPEKAAVLQTPKGYRWLPESAKRRFRRARQRAKRKETSDCASSNPKPLAAKPKKLSRWQRRMLERGTSPFTTCHRIYCTYSCRHSYRVLCSLCKYAWETEFSWQCPWRDLKEIDTLDNVVKCFPHPCVICPWYDNPRLSGVGSGTGFKKYGGVATSDVPDEVQRWWNKKDLSEQDKWRSNYWKRRKLRAIGHEEDSTVEAGWRRIQRG